MKLFLLGLLFTAGYVMGSDSAFSRKVKSQVKERVHRLVYVIHP